MNPRRRQSPGGQAEQARRRQNWLELIQTSGPFITLPVADRALPNGPPAVPDTIRARLRGRVEETLADHGGSRDRLIDAVLAEGLDWADHYRNATDLPDAMAEPVAEHPGVVLRPEFAFHAAEEEEEEDRDDRDGADDLDDEEDPDGDDDGDAQLGRPVNPAGPWRLLGMRSPWGTHPLATLTSGGWAASPVDRLARLLRARDVPVGVVTDGRWWALVWAPRGSATAAGVWDSGLWSEEPETLRAFVSLLGRARFLAEEPKNRLPELFAESLSRQEEITDNLGRQVREAVELLVGALDSLDEASDRHLLAGVDDDDFYDGVVTVMMRVVFFLFAEERRLLPSDDATYVESYSVGRLVEQLEGRATLDGEASLEHRTGAWHRLLAVSRAIYAGVAHEDLRFPAYGGGLFDPDRYPWLEGRRLGQPLDGSRPPDVDDRTVLRMLRSVQYVEVAGERRRLTFRALDVEQIGYVYEGLLETEVRTATEPVLAFVRAKDRKKQKAPAEVPVSQALDAVRDLDRPRLADWLVQRTGWTKKKSAAALDAELGIEAQAALQLASAKDDAVAAELAPLAAALRLDERDQPIVFAAGARYVGPSTRRVATGTHYTPKSLAEDVVINTLEPLVYRPGPLDTADRTAWRLRPSPDIVALRVADIAMGSGAFLVAACRYLAEKLLEAWAQEGRSDAVKATTRRAISSDTDAEPVLLEARRQVADHCLYGVDINPLAVEMAKLSLWLITMDRERPFGFLDDRFRCGDSLLGLVSTAQLKAAHLEPEGRRSTDIADYIRPILQEAADIRRRITAHDVVEIRDVEHKARLLAEAERITARLVTFADAITGEGLVWAKAKPADLRTRFLLLSDRIRTAIQHDDEDLLRQEADADLQRGRPEGTAPRNTLHWPLAFPEVFADSREPGFDAVLGNPPFLGGKRISGPLGDDYRAWLQRWDARSVKGVADLVAAFVLRANRLLSPRGQLGYIATNTLVQGDTLEVGLLQATADGLAIRRGESSHKWPTRAANLEIVSVWATRAVLSPNTNCWLDGEPVPHIGPDLEPVGKVGGRPSRLWENEGKAFIGSLVNGTGFLLEPEDAQAIIAADAKYSEVVQPYLVGKDLNQRADSSPSRWVINFQDWPLETCERYVEALELVRQRAKPHRDKVRRAHYRDRWWLFAERGVELYETIAGLDHVLVIAQTSNTLQPVRLRTGPVFSHMCVVFAFEDSAHLAVLGSSVHVSWVVRYAATMRTDVRYIPTDVFVTFPRPSATDGLESLGRTLDTERRELMLSRSWGLTMTYNHVHDPTDTDPAVVRLRDIHAAIDRAVFDAYGWTDLDPHIGHHPTKIGTRWTVSPEVRFEILDRLLAENHRRHAAEFG
jgi:hypothetical protein